MVNTTLPCLVGTGEGVNLVQLVNNLAVLVTIDLTMTKEVGNVANVMIH